MLVNGTEYQFVPYADLSGANLRYADLSGAHLSGADLSGADLSGADLSGANLSDADLSGAHLSGADLSGANLRYADLRYAHLSGADLRYANLSDANLSDADLSGAHLSGANLSDANLSDANLRYAHLSGADLRGAHLPAGTRERLSVLPEGDIIGWKKCRDDVLVKLKIPAAAKRSNATTRKCRAEYAEVLEVTGAETGVSTHDSSFTYTMSQTVRPLDPFNEEWTVECGSGIHFFITKLEAEEYR